MSATMRDVAHATGLSLPTVSRVLSGSSYPINDETRQRVLAAAEALGYQPNLAARGLRTKRTTTIGIVVDDILSAFVPPIVRGIQDRLTEAGFSGMLVNADWDTAREQAAIAGLLSRPVDGILFVEYSHFAHDEALRTSGKPHLFVHRLFGTPIPNSVVPDERYGAELAADHLLGLGHRQIAMIAGPHGWHSARKRLDAFGQRLAEQGLPLSPERVVHGDWETESGYRAARRLLALLPRLTAIFAANDLMALGAIYAAQDLGLQVPGDLAVVGYDNRDFARLVRPAITTVTLPTYEMGQLGAGLLLGQILRGEGAADEVKVRGELMVRESCGAPAALRSAEEPSPSTTLRRLLLNRHPDA
jgi:LacI family transcriptional regulator